MKSSTIRRSTLSKESIEVIENLSKEQEMNNIPGEYVRPEEEASQETTSSSNKSQEIDLLWQTFKSSQFNSNSPAVYLFGGFVAGILITVIAIGCLGAFVLKSHPDAPLNTFIAKFTSDKKHNDTTLEQQTSKIQETESPKVLIPTEEENITDNQQSETVNSTEEKPVNLKNSKKYVVKDGDTGEKIIKHFYGTYSPEKADLIIKANNLKSLDRINIDQELIIPIE